VVSQSSITRRVFNGVAGMAGLAPAEIIIGDLICQFKGCDELVIIRKEARGFRLIGGAASFHSPTSSWIHAGGDVHKNNKGDSVDFTLTVHVYLDIASLDKLLGYSNF
jgi:hypothetical protein